VRKILLLLGALAFPVQAGFVGNTAIMYPPAAAGGITIESKTVNTDPGSVSSITLTKPTGVATDDFLILLVGNDDGTNFSTWIDFDPTNWTQEWEYGNSSSDAQISAYWRIADGTEATTVTPTHAGSAQTWGVYIRLDGVDTTTPFDVAESNVVSVGSTATAPSITTATNNALALVLWAWDGADGSTFSIDNGFSIEDDITAGSGGNASSGGWATKSIATAGAIGATIVTASTSDGNTAAQFALRPE